MLPGPPPPPPPLPPGPPPEPLPDRAKMLGGCCCPCGEYECALLSDAPPPPPPLGNVTERSVGAPPERARSNGECERNDDEGLLIKFPIEPLG
ncbi:hypothetical protein BD310DRAFT_928842 [Dichomitus squalens]|uniref:Uncharacterized protein n=1 Tax=Dichomitus squalens TaxID=114155 RepID=A0A4Q9PT95_9APHY|nr:hypothetical protein BD310DRAFT_928842 [Dichomitus squalens]